MKLKKMNQKISELLKEYLKKKMKISLRVKINQQIMIHLIIKKLMKILFMKFQKIIFLIIKTMKLKGGFHPYVHGGVTYDTRDRLQNPTRGIHADAFLTYYAGLGDMKDYNDLKLNLGFRQYLSLYTDRLILAYRVGAQLNLAGDCPFYLNTYLNQLYMQRVIYEGLGGANSVRGIMRNRILAPGVAFANVELRSRVASLKVGKNMFYLGLVPFLDAGMVVQPYRPVSHDPQTGATVTDDVTDIDNRLYAPHLGGGLGLKVAMNDNFVLSVDWATAFDKQDNGKLSNLYIKMGYMF